MATYILAHTRRVDTGVTTLHNCKERPTIDGALGMLNLEAPRQCWWLSGVFAHACASPIFGDVWLLLVSKPHHSTTAECLLRPVYLLLGRAAAVKLSTLASVAFLPFFRWVRDWETDK